MGIAYIDPDIFASIEEGIAQTRRDTGSTVVLLIDRSGAVITLAGEPPLHPRDLGAIAAGLFGAMETLIKAARLSEFEVRVPEITSTLVFVGVGHRLFLCAFHNDLASTETVRTGLRTLAESALKTMAEAQTAEKREISVSFIEDKLNELFDRL